MNKQQADEEVDSLIFSLCDVVSQSYMMWGAGNRIPEIDEINKFLQGLNGNVTDEEIREIGPRAKQLLMQAERILDIKPICH